MQETKLSPRAMEAAMSARLFRDMMIDSAGSLIERVIMRRDETTEVVMESPRAHPSFTDQQAAITRLSQYIDRLLAGERFVADKNPLVRLSTSAGVVCDLSLESFSQAALGDDGVLVIPVGRSEAIAGTRVNMDFGEIARFALRLRTGNLIRRQQALLPMREIMEARRRHQERLESLASARALESQGIVPVVEPAPVSSAQDLSDRLGRVSQALTGEGASEVSSMLADSLRQGTAVVEPAPATPMEPQAEPIIDQSTPVSLDEMNAPISLLGTNLATSAQSAEPFPPLAAEAPSPLADSSPARSADAVRADAELPVGAGQSQVLLALNHASEQWHEVCFFLQPDALGALLEELDSFGEFEAKISRKGERLALEIAVRKSALASISPIVSRHKSGPVMLRAKKR